MEYLAITAGVLATYIIYWPLYRRVERDRLTDATLARYARRYGK